MTLILRMLLINTVWMGWNLVLAFVPLIFFFGYFRVKNKYWKFINLFLFVIFLPNSPYVVSDLTHLTSQAKYLKLGDYASYLVYAQYFLFVMLGIIPYLFTQYILVKRQKKIWRRIFITLIIPILMAIGVMLGREFRFNSWDIFTSLDEIMVSVSAIAYDSEVRQGTVVFWIIAQILSVFTLFFVYTKTRIVGLFEFKS